MKIKLKSKCGRAFWRAGKQLSPDEWTEVDVDAAQLKAIELECAIPVSKGGSIEMMTKAKAEPKT